MIDCKEQKLVVSVSMRLSVSHEFVRSCVFFCQNSDAIEYQLNASEEFAWAPEVEKIIFFQLRHQISIFAKFSLIKKWNWVRAITFRMKCKLEYSCLGEYRLQLKPGPSHLSRSPFESRNFFSGKVRLRFSVVFCRASLSSNRSFSFSFRRWNAAGARGWRIFF